MVLQSSNTLQVFLDGEQLCGEDKADKIKAVATLLKKDEV